MHTPIRVTNPAQRYLCFWGLMVLSAGYAPTITPYQSVGFLIDPNPAWSMILKTCHGRDSNPRCLNYGLLRDRLPDLKPSLSPLSHRGLGRNQNVRGGRERAVSDFKPRAS